MALDTFASSVISLFIPPFSVLRNITVLVIWRDVCSHTCVYVHVYEICTSSFNILYSIEPVGWTLATPHRGSESYLGLVIPTWPVCDGASLLLLVLKGLFRRLAGQEGWISSLGNLDVWKQYLYVTGIPWTVLSTGAQGLLSKVQQILPWSLQKLPNPGKKHSDWGLRVVTGSLFLTGWIQRQWGEKWQSP